MPFADRRQQLFDVLARVVLDSLNAVFGQAGLHQSLLRRSHQRGVAAARLSATAQHDRISTLEGERSGLDGDVGPRLIDDRQHSKWNAAPKPFPAIGAAAQSTPFP